MSLSKLTSIVALVSLAFLCSRVIHAQEVKHPEMELSTNDKGEDVVVVVATQRPPDPNKYEVRTEKGKAGNDILAVYYINTGELVTFFARTTIKGKVEGPGVSLFLSRVAPQIEKVIGQKSYERELKRRYLELVYTDKNKLRTADRQDDEEVKKIVERKRN